MRCVFHETYKGIKLFLYLSTLVVLASIITYLINQDNFSIALASCLGFAGAQLFASIFYQISINRSYFVKVNGSDLIGIVIDSIVFQLIAFGSINTTISISQIFMKFFGGLFWYWIIFKKFKLIK